MAISTICLLLAFLCFLFSAFGVTARINLQSLGLALMVLAALVA